MDFVHLHCHTEYSLLDGAIKLNDLCAKTVEFGLSACAITDHGNMYAAAYFARMCADFKIKPIFGCEVYICPDHTDKTNTERSHLILLAQNMTGYHNLVKLVSLGHLEGFYYRPRIDKKQLAEHSEGLICLSACIAGEIPKAILKKKENPDLAMNLAKEYAAIFPERFYLEVQANGLDDQTIVNNGLLEIADQLKLPLVATNDCHYLNEDDYDAHEVLLCVQTQSTMQSDKRFSFSTNEFYYKSPEKMAADFSEMPKEVLTNSAKIAEMCNVELVFGKHFFPRYPLAEGVSAEQEFRKLAEAGLEKRLTQSRLVADAEVYRNRLQHELDVICDMGFPSYFLIVQEFINWAKKEKIPVGPGRGSAAGSLVAWALRITNIDPLAYNLLFERFLNSERVSLPDIDVDFCERRRGEVIQHIVELYGRDCVAQITTFGTMKAKGVVRDVGRALGMSYNDTNQIAKLIPDDLKMTIDKALEENELKTLYQQNAQVKQLIDTAKHLEGIARHASTHAAGVVVSDKPMTEYLPLYRGKRGEIVTQFDGPMTEKIGLVKFDFLGLKTMTLIQDTLDSIKNQKKAVPDLDNLTLDDPKVFELYSRGDTDGIFQVESGGMRQYLQQLKPSCFSDIIAMLALYRPGPLGSGMVDEFIKRRHGQVPVSYPHPALENCLRETYGVIVYQEQVMQIAQIIAKYTLGDADLLRRAMGKKNAAAMEAERERFLQGARANNVNEAIAVEIFALMEKFAAYGFNKSHSAAYALVSYQTAYLKVYHKVDFMAALLTAEQNNPDKMLKYINYCRSTGIKVLPPDVNKSRAGFTAVGDQILFGLGGIKNVGEEALNTIIQAREKGGDFVSLLDFCSRISGKRISSRIIENLIKGCTFDCLKVSRIAMLKTLDAVMEQAKKQAKANKIGQNSLFGNSIKEKPINGLGIDCEEANMPEMDENEKIRYEKEVLGIFLAGHPLQKYHKFLPHLAVTSIDKTANFSSGTEFKLAAIITGLKELQTKKGDRMAFVSIEDLSAQAEVTCFPELYNKNKDLLNSDQVIYLSVKLDSAPNSSEDTNVFKFLANGITSLDEICANNDIPIDINVTSDFLNTDKITELRTILDNNPGKAPVFLVVKHKGYECRLKVSEQCLVNPCPEFDREIEKWRSVY